MDNFNKIRAREDTGALFLTDEQQEWIDAHRLGLAHTLQKRIVPPEGWRARYFTLVQSNAFDLVITVFIALNTIVMAMKHDGIAPGLSEAFEYLNYLFAAIFQIEMILKLIGLGKQYFYSAWNVFDCIVVIGTDIGIVLKFVTSGSSFSTAATVVRAFRIMRIVRLVRSYPDIRLILDTLVNIIPQITNFVALMFLMIFIYAALGMNLFCGVVYQDFVDEKNNFRTISNAMIYLFRCSTGEDWNKIMHELSSGPDEVDCINDQDYYIFVRNGRELRGCGTGFAQFYFISFSILIAWLIMNLAVAAVIEGLEHAQSDNSGTIEGDDVKVLLEGWMRYDPDATGWISARDFVALLIELPKPFGDDEMTRLFRYEDLEEYDRVYAAIYNYDSYYCDRGRGIIIKNAQMIKYLELYKVKTYEGHVGKFHYKDVYDMFLKRIFQDESEDFKVSKHLKKKMKEQWAEKHKKVKELTKSTFKSHQSHAIELIRKHVQNYKARKAQIKAVQNMEADGKAAVNRWIGKATMSKALDKVQGIVQQRPAGGGVPAPATTELETLDPTRPRPANRDQDGTSRGNRKKNMDENPQEFDEVGSQEEQSQGRALEQIQQRGRAHHEEEKKASQERKDSMDDRENLPDLKMDQSITDSKVNRSDMNLLDPNEKDALEDSLRIQGDAQPSRSKVIGSREDLRRKRSNDPPADVLPSPPKTPNADGTASGPGSRNNKGKSNGIGLE
jgi:hypothetical protein